MKHTFANARIAFPDIFEANKDGKFAAAFIFEPEHAGVGDNFDDKTSECKAKPGTLRYVVDQVGQAKWGAKWPTIRKELNKGDNLLVHDGDSKASYVGYEGNLFFNANNTVRPTVVDRDRSPLVAADGKPYSGCYVNVIIDVWAQDNQYGKKVNAQLQGIQFVKDGEAFSGGGTSADASDFDEIADGADADDLA